MKKTKGGLFFLIMLTGMLALSAIILAVLSAMMMKGHMSADFASGGVIAAYVISCLAGGFAMGMLAGKNKFLWGMLIGCGYFAILFLLGRIIYHTSFALDVRAVSSFFICIVAGMLGGMLAPGEKTS